MYCCSLVALRAEGPPEEHHLEHVARPDQDERVQNGAGSVESVRVSVRSGEGRHLSRLDGGPGCLLALRL